MRQNPSPISENRMEVVKGIIHQVLGVLLVLNAAQALAQQPTKGASLSAVAPAMPHAEIEAGLKSRDKALYIKEGWIGDAYIRALDPAYAIPGPDEVQKF